MKETLQEAIKGPKGSELDILTRLASGLLGPKLAVNLKADRRAMATANALLQRIRVQGPTAYFARDAGSMHAASAWTQAAALWLWSAFGKYAENPLAPLVASRLLEERCPWQQHLPARDIIMASLGLGAFDEATGSAAGRMPLRLKSGPSGKLLLQAGRSVGADLGASERAKMAREKRDVKLPDVQSSEFRPKMTREKRMGTFQASSLNTPELRDLRVDHFFPGPKVAEASKALPFCKQPLDQSLGAFPRAVQRSSAEGRRRSELLGKTRR
ncbi:unnamed protein product [Effrenium voratum]|nr:unnamed protein product [Effrenium voratum]